MPYDWERKGERGFFCEGESERGVPVLTGTWDAPPLGFCLFFLILGSVGIAFALWHGTLGLLSDGPPLTVAAFLLLWSGIYFANGVFLFRLRRRILRLSPAEDLCRQFGIEAAVFRRVVQERGIRPHYDINGRDFYDPADFGEGAVLLRPAPPPSESLLRPLPLTSTPADQLLHPADHET